MKPPPIADTSLVGYFFHSVHTEGAGKRPLVWQGHVLSRPDPGFYLVQLYEWMLGEAQACRLVRIEDMLTWSFYPTNEAMQKAYNRHKETSR